MTTIINTQTNVLNNAQSVNAYVAEFNLFAAKTADAIIGMGRVVFRAKQNLGSDFAKCWNRSGERQIFLKSTQIACQIHGPQFTD
jgi:hypothetical protein